MCSPFPAETQCFQLARSPSKSCVAFRWHERDQTRGSLISFHFFRPCSTTSNMEAERRTCWNCCVFPAGSLVSLGHFRVRNSQNLRSSFSQSLFLVRAEFPDHGRVGKSHSWTGMPFTRSWNGECTGLPCSTARPPKNGNP